MMNALNTTLTPQRQALIDRISAMNAQQFNACISARGEYQHAFDVWIEYQDEVAYDNNIDDPLPDPDILLEVVDGQFLEDIGNSMRVALAKAKQAKTDIDEEGIRQDVFTESFSDSLKEDLLATHNVTAASYDGIAQMDQLVNDGELSWSMIGGAGKDLDAALHMSRNG